MANSFSDHLLQGPTFHIDLAPLDSRHPEHYSCRLLVFRCTDSIQRNAQLSAFKNGLQALVRQCPFLGGRVVPVAPDTTEKKKKGCYTIVPGNGLELLVRDLRTQIPSFKDLEAADFSSSLLPEILLMPVSEKDDSAPACKVQYSAIEGGTIISFTISHHVADGSGTNEFMKILSEETRLASQGSSRKDGPVLGMDRSLLRNITSEIPFKIEDHPAFAPTGTSSKPANQEGNHPFKAIVPETAVLLRISPVGLALLKSDATQVGIGAPPISTHDALSALIWRTTMLIRSRRSQSSTSTTMPPSSTQTKLYMPSDARRHLNLPSSYIGNAVYQLTASLPLSTLLSPTGLQSAATSIRAAISSVTAEKVQSYMAHLKEAWVEWGFMTGTSTIAVAMGTDWTSGGVYSDDWGEDFGRMQRYRYPGSEGAFNCVYPRLGDGSAEIMVGCLEEEEGLLRGKEGFGRYLGV